MMLWLRQFKFMLIWKIYQSGVDVILEDIQLDLVIPIMYTNLEQMVSLGKGVNEIGTKREKIIKKE